MGWFSSKSKESTDEVIKELLDDIKQDKFVMDSVEKSNPSQEEIAKDQDYYTKTTHPATYSNFRAYSSIEVVNRGTNLITDAVAEFKVDIKDKLKLNTNKAKFIREDKLFNLLNYRANAYTTSAEFMRNMALDLILEGNAFVYFDGVYLYNLPAAKVEIETDKKEFIKLYRYANTEYLPEEIIHIRDNSAYSIFRGSSRLVSAASSIRILEYMNKYQTAFFRNNTMMGIIIKIKDTLTKKIKDRKILEWIRDYSPTSGPRKPLILDGGAEIEDLAKYSFRELDFAESIKNQERRILEALGVPPILLDSGNNANISPNIRLFYVNTVMPIVRNIVTSFELYFGYDLKEVSEDIVALRPDLKELANFLSTLTNSGIMTQNEARSKLRLPKVESEEADMLIKPANIAGSAIDSTTGGRPPNEGE